MFSVEFKIFIMKKPLLILIAFCSSLISINLYSQYCTGGPSSTFDSNTESVDLTGDAGTAIAYVACPGVAGVEDQTALSADLTAGTSYTANIQFGTCGGNYGGAGEVWIDWDQNQAFDASESIGTWSGTPPTTLSAFAFTVPATAVNGATRMRVIQQEGGGNPLDPCAGFTWGSAVDFTINISGGASPPSCSSPTGLTSSNNTTNSADLSWTPGGTETLWNIEWGASGFTLGTGTSIIGVTAIPYSLSGLNPATQYDFYVQADCGAGDTSSYAGPFSFQTLFNVASGVTCTTGNPGFLFSDNMDANNGWTGDIGTGNGQWDFPTAGPGGNSSGTGPSGPEAGTGTTWAEYEASGNSTTIASLVSPMIDLSASTGPVELSFYMHAFGTAIGILNVGVSNSATGPFNTEFSWAGQYQTAATDPWAIVGVDLSSYQGQQIYLEFSYRGDGSDWTGDLAIDLVQVESCLSCAIPTALNAYNITDTSASINWTAGGSETSWVVYLGNSGFTPGSGNAIAASNDTLDVTGLTANTGYEFYLQAICGTDSSALVGPFSFTTNCATFIAPWTESYDGTSTPSCWTESGSESWKFSTAAGYDAATAGDHTGNGGNYAWIDGSTPSGPTQISTLTSPFIDVSAMSNPTLDYWIYSHNTNDNTYNTLLVDLWDGSNWTQIDSIQQSLGSGWFKYTHSLNTVVITGDLQVRFTIREDASGSAFYNDILIDDVSIYEPLADDLAAINAYASESTGCELSDSVTICIDYINNGAATQYYPMMQYTINGGSPLIETTTDTINPGDTSTYCFTMTIDLSLDGVYDFVVSTNLMGDADSTNNSYSFTISNDTTPAGPTVIGDTICENSGDTLQLIASNSTGVINWYDAPGGNMLGSGDTLLVAVNTTTSYFASETYLASSQVHITEADLGAPDMVEIQNTSNDPIDVTGWRFIVSDDYTNWDANTIEQTLNGTMAPGDIMYWTDDANINYWGNNLFFNPGSPMWALLLDASGNVMDFMCVEWTSTDIASANITAPGGGSYAVVNLWNGDGVAGGSGSSLQRIGNKDNDDATDWVDQPTSTDSTNSGLSMPLLGGCPSDYSEAVAFIDPCASITEIGLEGFSIFPNPNNGEFNIINNGQSELINVIITDIQGKTIYNKQHNFNKGSQKSINLDGIENGVYIVKLTSTNGYKIFNVIIQ